jgi:hypothetical protein
MPTAITTTMEVRTGTQKNIKSSLIPIDKPKVIAANRKTDCDLNHNLTKQTRHASKSLRTKYASQLEK